jgi:hypothetical protein
MKKILFLSAIVSSVLLADSINVSLSSLKFNYKEYDSSANVLDSRSSSFSDLYGIHIRYTKNIGKFILNPNIEYNRGNTKYNGSTWDGTPLSLTEHNEYLYNINLIGKYNLFEDKTSIGKGKVYMLGGLGYRFDNRGKSDYSGDYDEQYKWAYYMIGGEINDKFNKFSIGLQAYYQKAINPKMKAYLGSGATYNLGKTDGYRISIPIKYALKTNYGISFRYIYDYWKITKSDTQNITCSDGTIVPTYEPDSKTKNQYLNIGFYYNF